GVQLLNNSIPRTGFRHTESRVEINPVEEADIDEFTGGLYYINEIKWKPKLRTYLGLRGDYFHFDVNNIDQPINTGKADTPVFSPKGALILGPFSKTDFFLNGGYDFHSNSAIAVTGVVQPTSIAPGAPLELVVPAPGIARTRGAEIGFRSQDIPNLTTSAALW